MVHPAFWQGKRVFITGHTGFKGSWLALWLQHMGAQVTGYARPALESAELPSLYRLCQLSTHSENPLQNFEADICDLPRLQKAMQAAAPDVVLHLAAQALVRYAYQEPVETYASNVMGSVHVLEAVRHTPGVRAVVMVTSDKCYENREWLWGYREDEAMGGYDPYSSSKGCAELVTAAYRRSYFPEAHFAEHKVAIASARAGNVIGGGDWSADRLLPDMLKAFMQQQPVAIRNPQAQRPWQHVLEPLHGYLLLAEKLYDQGLPFAQAWNFGPYDHDAWPVQHVADRLQQLWGTGAQWQDCSDPNAPHEAHLLKLDSSKARRQLGWQPCLGVEEALEWTVAWAKAWQAGKDMRASTLAQLEAYMARSAEVSA